MKPIRNISSSDLEIPFDFKTYVLKKNKTVAIPEDLHNFLKERYPEGIFSFDVEAKKEIPEVESYKTKSLIRSEGTRPVNEKDMYVSTGHEVPTFGAVDNLPQSGQTDSDGVAWFGEGVTIEGATE